MLIPNNTPSVHACVYLQYFNSALPGIDAQVDKVDCNLVQMDVPHKNVGKRLRNSWW